MKQAQGRYERSLSTEKGHFLFNKVAQIESSKDVADKAIDMFKNVLSPSVAHSGLRDSIKGIRAFVSEDAPLNGG